MTTSSGIASRVSVHGLYTREVCATHVYKLTVLLSIGHFFIQTYRFLILHIRYWLRNAFDNNAGWGYTYIQYIIL